jgi:hypothetical protein
LSFTKSVYDNSYNSSNNPDYQVSDNRTNYQVSKCKPEHELHSPKGKNVYSLLDNSFNKNYYEYSKIIYDNICPDKFTNKNIFLNNDVKFTNPFNKLLFVVKDKEALLNNISDKGYNVNQGPQQ